LKQIDFAGRVAVITGAGRGLGRQYALDIAARGGAVVVADWARDAGAARTRSEIVRDEILALGGKAIAVDADVATPAGGARIVESAMDTFGGADILVHNAGFLRPAPFEDMSDADVDEMIGVHLLGAFHVGRPVWREMKRKGYGRVVLTSSGSIFGYHCSANYAAAKAGLVGLSNALAAESGGLDIRANSILPLAQTNINKDNPIPGSKMGALADKLAANAGRWTANSVSPLVLYLASEACAVNGRSYSAVAGRYARVAWAVAEGYCPPELPLPEGIRDHLDAIEDLSVQSRPENMMDEFRSVLDRM
jgi:NAD(P)-dependent dehydrogenase (short-subunit alcohol dehydrogenase family)